MSYELLKNKLTNGTPFLKKDANKWIEALPLSTTPEQVEELKTLVEKNGLDVLPEDGEGRLTALEQRLDDTDLILGDIVLGGDMV